MRSAELKVNYANLDKPFELVERVHDMGGTDYYHICALTEDHAQLLNKEGVGWLYGEPNWDEHYKKIKIYKLEKQQKEISGKL